MARQGRNRSTKEDFNQTSVERIFKLIKLMKRIPRRTKEELADCVGVSVRSVYRYFNLIETLGFTLERNARGHIFITGSDLKESFTDQEAVFLREVLAAQFQNHPLCSSILRKLDLFSDDLAVADALLDAGYAQTMARLAEAMQRGCQIRLIGYHSAHSGTTSDRLVEPIEFVANYSFLSAYEIESSRSKFYRIDRITSVEVLEERIKHSTYHQAQIPDMFGFAMKEGQPLGHVHLHLSMRAALFLRSEYPLSVPYLKKAKHGDLYCMEGPVADYKPLARFLRGFLEAGEAEVHGDDAFLAMLREEPGS